MIKEALDLFLHLDTHLETIIHQYHNLTYFIIGLILFCETGLVVTPFLPGDSLLFAIGAVTASTGALELSILLPVMIIAVFLGDNVNYFIGSKIGIRLFDMNIPLLKKEYLYKTQDFYAKHGRKTIILARYVPIVRTFAPFVAGLGAMPYQRFIGFSVVGGITWVMIITLLGYFFGNIPVIKNNFELVLIAVVFISVIPIGIEWLKGQNLKKSA